MMKTCIGCGQDLALNMFWKQARRPDGLQAKCIACMSASHKAWREGLSSEQLQERSARSVASMDASRERDPKAQMFRSIKSRAKKAGLEFSLTMADIQIPAVCPVLGIPIIFGSRRGHGLREKDQRPSVDRIDNSKGYTPGNIIVVSYRANRIKSDATAIELAAIAQFYGGLDGATSGLGNISQEQSLGGAPDNMPAMLKSAQEQKGPVSFSEADGGRVPVQLLALRAQGGTVL